MGGYEAHLLRAVNSLLSTYEGVSCILSGAFLKIVYLHKHQTYMVIVLHRKHCVKTSTKKMQPLKIKFDS